MQIFGQNWPSAHHLILKLVHPHIYLSAMQKESLNEIYKQDILSILNKLKKKKKNKTHTHTQIDISTHARSLDNKKHVLLAYNTKNTHFLRPFSANVISNYSAFSSTLPLSLCAYFSLFHPLPFVVL